jgi:hypothetical protein
MSPNKLCSIQLTFLAIIVPVAMCRTLLTVPPLPWPRSFSTSKSSLFKSSLYSMPISNCAVCRVLSLALPPGIWRSLSEGATGRGAGAARARPLTFFLFRVRTEPMLSDILGFSLWGKCGTRSTGPLDQLLECEACGVARTGGAAWFSFMCSRQ